jgi:hypothetical protein
MVQVPGSLRAAASELHTQAGTVNTARRELNALGWLQDKVAQEGLEGLAVAFGAAFDLLEKDVRFMSKMVATSAKTYEHLDGTLFPQYIAEVCRRREERLNAPMTPGA